MQYIYTNKETLVNHNKVIYNKDMTIQIINYKNKKKTKLVYLLITLFSPVLV